MSILRTGGVTGGARDDAPGAEQRPVDGHGTHGARPKAKPRARFLQGYPATVIWQGFSLLSAAMGHDAAQATGGHGPARAANTNDPAQAKPVPQHDPSAEAQALPKPGARRMTVSPAMSAAVAYLTLEVRK